MAITSYTSYDEIRATLGVEAQEISDATLALSLYDLGLVADLADIAAALPADFAIVAAVTPPRSTTEQAFYDAVRVFAPYAVAVRLTGLPLFAPKTITDGKASITRDSGAPYKAAIAACQAMFDQARERLAARYAEYKGSSAAAASFRPLMAAVTPTLDPIVG